MDDATPAVDREKAGGPVTPAVEPPADARRVFITGANRGIGFEAALQLARSGDRVILNARDGEKADDARRRIQEAVPGAHLETAVGDLSTKSGVREAVREVQRHTDRIDVLILNAGLAQPRRRESRDGVELVFAVNHLSQFRLANLLHGSLAKSGAPRVIIVSSHAHRSARLDLDDVEMRNRRYSGWAQYCNTKLMNLLLMNALARRWRADGITVNALHPGVVATGIARNWWFGRLVFRVFGVSPEKGAGTMVYLATDPVGREVTAQYFAERTPLSPRRLAFDEAVQEKLWRISESYGV